MVKNTSLFSQDLLFRSILSSFQKLHPKYAFTNAVMATVWLGTLILFFQVCYDIYLGKSLFWISQS